MFPLKQSSKFVNCVKRFYLRVYAAAHIYICISYYYYFFFEVGGGGECKLMRPADRNADKLELTAIVAAALAPMALASAPGPAVTLAPTAPAALLTPREAMMRLEHLSV